MLQVCYTGTALGLAMAAAGAAVPVLTHLHPMGISPGTSAEVKLGGSFAPWPCQVWADDPGIVFTPLPGAAGFAVAVAAGVVPGPHLIRAYNAEGASAPISMVVDREVQTLEVEPNDDYRAPQVLASSTATCNGRLEKTGDVDCFRVELARGQTLVARVEAYVLASSCDAMLRVVDAAGTTLAFNHDHITMDPQLVFVAPQDGAYVVQVMGHKYPASTDVNFAGGEDGVYRLHLSTGPVVRNTWPLAVPRGRQSSVVLEGWNVPSAPVVVEEGKAQPFAVQFSDIAQGSETAEAQVMEVPGGMSGRLEVSGDEDHFSFQAKQHQALEFVLRGPSLGSLIDPWLKVRDAAGKELASNDDDGASREAKLGWTPPADGSYEVVVGDLTQRGGPDFYYWLGITLPQPTVAAAAAVSAWNIEAGKTVEIKVVVSFSQGFAAPLKLAAKRLPAGLAAAEVAVPDKGGEVTLVLTAEAAAPPGGQVFQLVLRESGGQEYPVRFSLVSVTENNGVPQGYQDLLTRETDQLWLTVTPPAPPPAPAAPAPAKP